MYATTDEAHKDLLSKGYKYHPIKSEPGKWNTYTKQGEKDVEVHFNKNSKVKRVVSESKNYFAETNEFVNEMLNKYIQE